MLQQFSGLTRRLKRIPAIISWRSAINLKSFTLISQNCIGGCIYHDLGVEFQSPFINCFVDGDDFANILSNLPGYLAAVATPNGYEKAGGVNCCPTIQILDAKVYALHYSSDVEAADCWNRRASRIDLSNVFVIANSWNCGYSSETIVKIAGCGYPTVVFTDVDYEIDNQILLKGTLFRQDDRRIVRPNLTDYSPSGLRYFEEMFDFVGWLNSGGANQMADYILDSSYVGIC